MSLEIPLAIDLYCGLGGWTEGFLAEGYRVIGFDIERHAYGDHQYPAQLVIQDVLTLSGSQFKNAACIVASPPCQAYSYRAMPWKRAKALPPPDNTLFEACFQIQREACEAAGRYIPMVVENVRGAEKWVGSAKWHFGSYYLWGDVPAIMPFTFKKTGEVSRHWRMQAGQKQNLDGTAHPPGSWFKIADSKNCGARSDEGLKRPGRNFHAIEHGQSLPSFNGAEHETRGVKGGWDNAERGKCRRNDGQKTTSHANMRDGFSHTRHLTNQRESDGVKQGGNRFHDSSPGTLRSYTGTKQPGIGGTRSNGKGDGWFEKGAAQFGSKSTSRKAVSAMIAKIPFPLARWIAHCFKPIEGGIECALGKPVKAKLKKLGICTCGYGLLLEQIPLGAEYTVYPNGPHRMHTLFCGNCGKQTRDVECIFASSLANPNRPGFLPLEMLELPANLRERGK